MFRLLNNRRGMALLVTLLVVSLLTAVTVYFCIAMRTDYVSAANLRESFQLSARAGSLFDYARAVLAVDVAANEYDALTETWALPEDLSGDAKQFFAAEGELEIIDQSGLLQVNALVSEDGQYNEDVRESFVRLLVLAGGVDEEDAENISDAVKDWLDSDDEVTRFGAESATYLSRQRPCKCKNGPIENLAELLLVQGMSEAIMYGGENGPGIAASLTPHGNDGTVNINTAPPSVLLALAVNMDAEMVEGMDEYRREPGNDLSSPLWYQNVRGDVNIVGAGVQSRYFEIVAIAKKGRMQRSVRGVVDRVDKNKIEVLSWQVE